MCINVVRIRHSRHSLCVSLAHSFFLSLSPALYLCVLLSDPHTSLSRMLLLSDTVRQQGVPHGDLKAANVLYVDGIFCLTDMPALNWSATPVLTKDPVAHTLVQGKRLLCNDMWGLGLITLSLVVGYTEMEAVKMSLRKLEPRAFDSTPGASRKMDAATQNWLVVSLMLLHFLGRAGTPMAIGVLKRAQYICKRALNIYTRAPQIRKRALSICHKNALKSPEDVQKSHTCFAKEPYISATKMR